MTRGSYVCPFCPLHCDDLDPVKLARSEPPQALSEPQRAVELGVTCALLARRLAPAIAHDAIVQVASDALIRQARDWIAGASRVLITGQIIDLETARAVCRVAEQTGATVLLDSGSESSAADTAAYNETFTREGIFTTTLGDAALPHRSLILIGDPAQYWPRLRERLSAAGETLIWQKTDALARRLAWLRRLLRRPQEDSPPEDPDLAGSRELCDRATSIVFVVAPGYLSSAEARPFWSTMSGLLGELNTQKRAALLRLDDQLTFRSVRAWSSDQQAKSPVGEPWGAADLVIELTNPWPRDAEPIDRSAQRRMAATNASVGKWITIGGQPTCGSAGAQVCWLPASTPGVGRHAVVLRGDGSVALPLRPLTATALPSPAEVLRRTVQINLPT